MRKFVVMTLLLFTACGNNEQQKTPAAAIFTSYSTGVYYNPSTTAITLSAQPASKVVALQAGDNVPVDERIRTAPIVVAGCIDTSPSELHVCYEAGQEEAAKYVVNFLSFIVAPVQQIVGPTGPIDIVVAKKSSSHWDGEFISETRTIIATVGDDFSELFSTIGHEVAHAAFFNARNTSRPLWLNEAIATLVESRSGYTRSSGTFNNIAFTETPGDSIDYFRAQRIGETLFSNSKGFPFADALKEADPLQALTGMDIGKFSEVFWADNQQFTPTAEAVPPFGAIRINRKVTGPAGLIKVGI